MKLKKWFVDVVALISLVFLLFLCMAIWPLTQALAVAAVEVNTASVTQLDTIQGIGPKRAAAITEQRQAQGAFKDWVDLIDRVKGIGPSSAQKLSNAGLLVNGRSYEGPPGRAALTAPRPESTVAQRPRPRSLPLLAQE